MSQKRVFDPSIERTRAFLSAALRLPNAGPRVEPLDELEQDVDVQAAIADVEELKRREVELRRKTRIQRFQATFKEWGRFSSYGGISHLVLADNNRVRLFWAIMVIISFVGFVYLLFITLGNYLAYKTEVKLDLKYEQFQFPSITICNASPYKLSQVHRSPGLDALVKLYNRLVADGKIKPGV